MLLVDSLDSRRGVLLSSDFEYPGRYTRWDMGFCDPPLVLEARAREFRLEALNERGAVLLPEWEIVLIYLLMLAVLLWRPWGLWGRPEAGAAE